MEIHFFEIGGWECCTDRRGSYPGYSSFLFDNATSSAVYAKDALCTGDIARNRFSTTTGSTPLEEDKVRFPKNFEVSAAQRSRQACHYLCSSLDSEPTWTFTEQTHDNEDIGSCTRGSRKPMELLCMHLMQKRIDQDQPLKVTNIQCDWRFVSPESETYTRSDCRNCMGYLTSKLIKITT